MKDYEECKKNMGNNICNVAHPYISYCDVNRNNLQCPEGLEPSKDIDESERTNQIILEYKLRIGIKMIEKIDRINYKLVQIFPISRVNINESIRQNFKKIDNK